MKTLAFVGLILLSLGTPAFAAEPDFATPVDPLKQPQLEVPKHTVWRANASAGFVWLAGNAESVGLSAQMLAGVKHWNNEFTLTAGGAFVYSGSSKYGTGGPVTDHAYSAGNWRVGARYDRYFKTLNTVFVGFNSSGDPFAGYDYRLEPQIGYSRIFFKSVHQLFRGELGYDYTFQRNVDTTSIDYHAGRLLLYYENKFTPYFTFSDGVEMLEAFNHLGAFRLNNILSLSTTITKYLSLKVNWTLRFNNEPPSRDLAKLTDPATGMPLVSPAGVILTDANGNPLIDPHFGKLDSTLDVVLAVTFI